MAENSELRKSNDSSQARGSVPITARPSVRRSLAMDRTLGVAEAERSVQERSRSLKMVELERYKTEQSLHCLRRAGGDLHECHSNSMNMSQRHAADAAPLCSAMVRTSLVSSPTTLDRAPCMHHVPCIQRSDV